MQGSGVLTRQASSRCLTESSSTFVHHHTKRIQTTAMVFLTITPSVMEGLQTWRDMPVSNPEDLQLSESDPPLDDAGVGSPISHGQIIDLWRALQDGGRKEYSLEGLLKGSCVYVPPPPPKPEPVSDMGRNVLGVGC